MKRTTNEKVNRLKERKQRYRRLVKAVEIILFEKIIRSAL